MPQPKQHWFRSRWLLVVCALVCVLMTISFVKEIVRSYRINQEIASLHKEIDSLQQHNQKTSDFVEYLKTDTYFQQEARLKLGLKEQGEKVVVLEPGSTSTTSLPDASPESLTDLLRPAVHDQNNPSRWLTYFFGAK